MAIEKSPAGGELNSPLEGIRVVEYGVFHAGPGGTAILGDLGAEIIKIEGLAGDPERYWTRVGSLDLTMPNGENAIFQYSNRNKRSLALDIMAPQGRVILEQLVAQADVFLTNVRQSTKQKLGLDYDTLRAINGRMIHANVSGYGPEGAMKDLGAFDPLGLARSGLMYATGDLTPKLMHIGILDQATAIAVSHAIITALYARERTGQGQEVHVSLYSVGQWLNGISILANSLLGVDTVISENRTVHSPLRNIYRCKDGRWIICTHHPEEKYWVNFCEAIEQPRLITDPRFAVFKNRMANRPALIEIMDRVFAEKTADEWMEIFVVRGLMFCPVQRVGEIKNDPQALINGYIVDYEDPDLGTVRIPGYPVHFSSQTAGTRSLAPILGEHTREVLKELGYADTDIDRLITEGVAR